MPKTTNQKEQIVQAALKLFAAHGYAGTSVRMIATEAGVSYTLMYIFFSSKEEVLQEIIDRGFADIKTSMSNYNKGFDPRKAIQLHITKTIEIIRAKREFWQLLHSIRMQKKVMTASAKKYSEITRYVTSVFTSVFKKLNYKKPELEAILFLAQIDGLVILYLQNNSIPLDKLSQQIIQRYKK